MSWLRSYVGKPFAEGGRGPDAFDCWGLVRAVYLDVLGVDLPMHDEIGTDDHRRVAREMQSARAGAAWSRVDRPREFDVMVARRDAHSRYPGHVGVMVDGGRVLHIWKGRDAHVSRLREPALCGLIMGVYRHEFAPC